MRAPLRSGLLPLGRETRRPGRPGCGKKNPTEPRVDSGVDAYLSGLPRWSAFSPRLTTPGGVVDDSVGVTQSTLVYEEGAYYARNTTPHHLTATPSQTVTMDAAPPTNILYVGALLQGRGLVAGEFEDVPVAGTLRAPLRITIDILSSGNAAVVQNPDALTVGAAVQGLIEEAARNGLSAGTATSFDKQESYSLEQSLLSLGISARYGLAKVAAKSSTPPARFLGVVSAVPITRIFFDEGSSGDDIVIKSPCFGWVTGSGLVSRSVPAFASRSAVRAGPRIGRLLR